jgi:hypothetical protein
MKIPLAVFELLYEDSRTDRRDELNKDIFINIGAAVPPGKLYRNTGYHKLDYQKMGLYASVHTVQAFLIYKLFLRTVLECQ